MATAMGIATSLTNFLARKQLIGAREEYRVLAPICSALETRSYKMAVQLCGKALKKQPDYYVVIALMVVALFQGSKPITASILQQVLAYIEYIKSHANGAGLADPDVLVFLGWVLNDLGKSEEQLAVLALATQRHSDNEQVCVEVFQDYCRMGERKSAQQLSMKMQRTFKDSKYLWWSAITMLLQVQDPTNTTTDLLLSLTERQITSHYTALRLAAGSIPSSPVIDGQRAIEGAEAAVIENGDAAEENGTVKAPGRDKGKGKASPQPTAVSSPTNDSTSKAVEFDTVHEFYLATRFLDLRLLRAESKLATTTAITTLGLPPSPPVVLPSLPTSDVPLSPRQTLLTHFASKEADRWCERGIGLEIYRREVELRHGSVEGREWEASWERMTASLEKGDSNWHTMLYTIRCAFSLAGDSSKAYSDESAFLIRPFPGPSPAGESLLSKTRALFRRLADDGDKGRKERGFLLALLEIAHESRRRGWAEADPLLPLIEEYFERFATKMCCFDDLRPYLENLTSTENDTLVTVMLSASTSWDELAGVSIASGSSHRAQRIISAAKITRFISHRTDEAYEDAAADASLQRYFEALPLGKGLPLTELQPADDFALLAAQSYVAAFGHSRQRSYLEKAAAVLDYASFRSKHKYQIRILLINIYRLLGASSLALSHYRQLGVKSVQFDTLSHLVLGRASTFSVASGNDPGVLQEATIASNWYSSGEVEAREMVVRAFSFHNYTNIEDFITFQGRLKLSLSKYMMRIETLRMQVLSGALNVAAAEKTLDELVKAVGGTTPLSDNRDFKTLPNLQPQSQPTIWEQTTVGPGAGSSWLRALSGIYSTFLVPTSTVVDVESCLSSELTPSETGLLHFARAARQALTAGLEDVSPATATLEFFQGRERAFIAAVEDPSTLPWELLHIASTSLEGYCLLDLAVEQRLSELTATKVPDHAKLTKALRNLRTTCRETVRSIGAKVTSYGKQVAKQKVKTNASLAGLTKFPLLDEDHITNFSHALVESRKSMAEGLGAAIHRRCSK